LLGAYDDWGRTPLHVAAEQGQLGVASLLIERGAEVTYHDPHVPVIKPTREHPHWAGTKSVPLTQKVLDGVDLVLIATNHAAVNYVELAEARCLVVDTRNAMAGLKTKEGQVWKA
jgi:UDP-N-acetyl-D-glucosamine dehydrogenase